MFNLINNHLADANLPQKRAKKSSDYCEWAEKPRDYGQETASSHHEEDASLGKRSASDPSEFRLWGRRKDVSHFLDSISHLEGMLADFEQVDLSTSEVKATVPEVRLSNPAILPRQTPDSIRLGRTRGATTTDLGYFITKFHSEPAFSFST